MTGKLDTAQSGNESRPKMGDPYVSMANKVVIRVMMFMPNPGTIISKMDIVPAPKTMALGGVPTGSMNA